VTVVKKKIDILAAFRAFWALERPSSRHWGYTLAVRTWAALPARRLVSEHSGPRSL